MFAHLSLPQVSILFFFPFFPADPFLAVNSPLVLISVFTSRIQEFWSPPPFLSSSSSFRQTPFHLFRLQSLYRSPNIVSVIKSKRFRWVGHVARIQEGRSAFKIFLSTPTGKRPFGSPRSKWEDNIRMDRKEIGINTRNWIDSAWLGIVKQALVNVALNLRVL